MQLAGSQPRGHDRARSLSPLFHGSAVQLRIGRGDNNRSTRFTVLFLVVHKGLREANRNVLYLIIGALAVATAGLGYQSIEINIGQRGVSIEKK